MNNNVDKNLWITWWVLVIFVLLNTAMFFVSSHTKIIEFTLNKNEKLNVNLFRLYPHHISIKIIFLKTDDLNKSVLGEWKTVGDWKKTGILEFINPGEPIKLLVSNIQQKKIYEAMPAESSDSRPFKLYEDDNNPNKFSWGAHKYQGFDINAGFNKFEITVLEVGKSLKGRKVKLYINPPLGFQHAVASPLYTFLWFFYLWPIYLFFLFIFYLVLIFRKWNRQRKLNKA